MMKIQICLLFLSATLLAVSLAFPAEKSAPLSGAAEIDSVDRTKIDEKDARRETISSDDLQIPKGEASTKFVDCTTSETAAGAIGVIGGAAVGAGIGSLIFPGLGTLIGGIIGALFLGSSMYASVHYTC